MHKNQVYLIVTGFLILLNSCSLPEIHDNQVENSGPISVAFEIGELSNGSSAPALVSFMNLSENATSFIWNFGDPTSGNNTSNEKDPQHLYNNPGTYLISLIGENTTTEMKDTATTTITIEESKTFNFTYSTSPEDGFGTKAISTDLEEFYIFGYTSKDGVSNVYYSKIENGGRTINNFPIDIDHTTSIGIVDAILTNDGNFAMVGFQGAAGIGNNTVVTFLIMDKEGNFLSGYPKTLGTEPNGAGLSVIQTREGNFAIAGQKRVEGGVTDIFFVMLDENGNEISGTNRIFSEFDFTETGEKVLQLQNGDILLVGCDGTLGRTFVHRMNSAGSDISGFPIYYDSFNGNTAVELQDGSIVLAGGNRLLRISVSGEIFEGFPKFFQNQLSIQDILLTHDNSIVFTGKLSDEVVLYKVDLNGNLFPSFPKTYPPSNNKPSIANSIIQNLDGGFLMVGSSDNAIHVVKTNAEGEVL